MKNWASLQKALEYVKRNWFKVFLISFILYVFINKDFSFSVNLNDPDPTTTPGVQMEEPGKKEKKKNHLLTQKRTIAQKPKAESGLFDRIRLPFIGGGRSSEKRSELAQIDKQVKQAYLKRFAHVAQNEQKKFGIPASIILSNALLHSFAGQRDLSLAGNNHFAIPCTTAWMGASGTYQDACYRHYESAWSSFRDHSLYITKNQFAHLTQLKSDDYKGWAKGLEKAGFSDFGGLAKSLVKIIEEHGLHQLD
ncbi:MAG: glucosaminidase domain-containing protein [Bacteroidota bacterium]